MRIAMALLLLGCGAATFPWATFPPHDDFQGIIIKNTCATGPALLAHEMGHYFSLYHTHMTVYGVECPDGSNGDVAGDMLVDTPADPKLSGRVDYQTCVYIGTVPPPDGCDPDVPYDPDPSNIMSYAPAHCQRSAGVPRRHPSVVSAMPRSSTHRPQLIQSSATLRSRARVIRASRSRRLVGRWTVVWSVGSFDVVATSFARTPPGGESSGLPAS